MKLDTKHIAPYLPYQLKFRWCQADFFGNLQDGIQLMINISIRDGECTLNSSCIKSFDLSEVKPILRPISDLHKPIQDNGNWIIPANFLYREFDVTDMKFNGDIIDPKYGYDVYVFLISHHFDVFCLIDASLAIDINTIES